MQPFPDVGVAVVQSGGGPSPSDLVVLAHGGGVPEVLTLVLPILIFTCFMLVQRRTRRRDEPTDVDPPGPAGEPPRTP